MSHTKTNPVPTKILEAKLYIEIPSEIDRDWAIRKITSYLQPIWGKEVRVTPMPPKRVRIG